MTNISILKSNQIIGKTLNRNTTDISIWTNQSKKKSKQNNYKKKKSHRSTRKSNIVPELIDSSETIKTVNFKRVIYKHKTKASLRD